MSKDIPVWVGTPAGQWFEVADHGATVEHVVAQVQKGSPIPVRGPVVTVASGLQPANEPLPLAGYMLPRWVMVVRWARSQP